MIERLVRRLTYSPIGALRSIFSGGSRAALETDPIVQERIIARIERHVYGPDGLDAYERRDANQLARAARRSLAQHLCQRAQYTSWNVRVARITAFAILTPLLTVSIIVETIRVRVKRRTPGDPRIVIFFWAQRLEKFVWDGMFEGRPHVLHTGHEVHFGLAEAWFALRAIVAVPQVALHPELASNVVRWLAYYGFVRRRYEPTLVAHFFESTASSSLITAYLHEHRIRHCDIQHGELRFTATCAFAEFDVYRLWGAHFRDVLAKQRSPGDRMQVVGVPFHRDLFVRVRRTLQPRPRRLLIIDAFLADDWDHDEHILRILRLLSNEWEVRLRRHPEDRTPEMTNVTRWNADPEIQRLRVRIEEERPSDMSITDALARSRVVVGVSSAALLEAWLAGGKVIYVPGGPSRDAVMTRHRGSPNVCHLADEPDLDRFLSEVASLDAAESDRVNYVFQVTSPT